MKKFGTSLISKLQTDGPQLMKVGALGSLLGLLLYRICINDLPSGISSYIELPVDNTSIFSVVDDTKKSANDMNVGLENIST